MERVDNSLSGLLVGHKTGLHSGLMEATLGAVGWLGPTRVPPAGGTEAANLPGLADLARESL